MESTEHNEMAEAELWNTIPFEQQAEIDLAIDRGSKPEAVNRCMCAGKGFTLLSAKRVVEQRELELKRRHTPKTK